MANALVKSHLDLEKERERDRSMKNLKSKTFTEVFILQLFVITYDIIYS